MLNLNGKMNKVRNDLYHIELSTVIAQKVCIICVQLHHSKISSGCTMNDRVRCFSYTGTCTADAPNSLRRKKDPKLIMINKEKCIIVDEA